MTEDALSPEEVDALLADTENYDDPEEAGEIESVVADIGLDERRLMKRQREEKNELTEPSALEQQNRNIQLLLDIYMQITVELGRTSYKVKDILGWGESSLINLEKPATEPVNLLVNKKLVARGEVVVIDENFGVRITEIVNPRERLMSLTK